MPHSYDTDILIVGAGPVGLMAACQLQRFGVPHRLIDRRSEYNKKSKAAGVWSRSMDAFDSLGLSESFMMEGNHAKAFVIHSKGEEIGRLDLDEIKSRYNYLLILPQEKTEAILRDHYISQGGVVELGTELNSLEQTPEGVAATLHTQGGVQTIHCQYLVASDGISSTVRELLDVPFEGKAIAADWIVGDMTVDGPIPEDAGCAFFHEDGPCVFFPMGHKRHRIIGLVKDRKDEVPSLEEFQELIDLRTMRPLKFSEPRDIAYFRIQERQVKHYRVGRCFFAGDAAHVHSPAGGQGMNTGLQDAHNLGWKLALAAQGVPQNETLLDSYHTERHPVAAEVLEKTGRATNMIMLESPLLQTVRNHAISFLTSLPAIQAKGREALSELAIDYAKSPLTHSQETWLQKHLSTTGPQAGDYITDVRVAASDSGTLTRLAEIIRPAKFHLICFEGKEATSAERLSELATAVEAAYPTLVQAHLVVKDAAVLNGRLGYLDLHLEAHEHYHTDKTTACLIRPDGYIACQLHDPSLTQLTCYFKSIGLA